MTFDWGHGPLSRIHESTLDYMGIRRTLVRPVESARCCGHYVVANSTLVHWPSGKALHIPIHGDVVYMDKEAIVLYTRYDYVRVHYGPDYIKETGRFQGPRHAYICSSRQVHFKWGLGPQMRTWESGGWSITDSYQHRPYYTSYDNVIYRLEWGHIVTPDGRFPILDPPKSPAWEHITPEYYLYRVGPRLWRYSYRAGRRLRLSDKAPSGALQVSGCLVTGARGFRCSTQWPEASALILLRGILPPELVRLVASLWERPPPTT